MDNEKKLCTQKILPHRHQIRQWFATTVIHLSRFMHMIVAGANLKTHDHRFDAKG